ncbi:cytochrome P450 [Marasmius fiardii PR-910]|nr:cytochrome P450 [Marasmius fiardii PR-910]
MDSLYYTTPLGIFAAYCGYRYLYACHVRSKLHHIPTLGSDGIFSSYATAWRFFKDGRAVIEEGCEKYGSAFKIPTLDGWQVVVNGPKMLEDMRKAPETELSATKAFNDLVKSDYTIAPENMMNPYQIDVVRTPLTRNIGARFEDVRDEIVVAFDDNFPHEHDWVEMSVIKPIQNVVVRASNRLIVDLPLCHNEDYCELNVQFTIDVITDAIKISLFPRFMHPIVGPLISKGRANIKRATKHLAPILQERIKQLAEHGPEWEDKPNDYITWVIEANRELGADWQRGSIKDLVLRVLSVNLAAIHTTSTTFTHTLYQLAAHPEVVPKLREEVEEVTAREGWTKAAMVQLKFMDSFLKETQRLTGVSAVTMTRVAAKDFTFSDGTFLPAGTKVAFAAQAVHESESCYPNPATFRPARFSDMREKEGEGVRHQMITPTSEWLLFGHGKHACPGRFFAVNELKSLLAHLVMTYDIKFPDHSPGAPEPMSYAGNPVPNPNAKVLFRRRKL